MRDRILTGWTFTRMLYLIMGSLIIIQSVMEKQWLGLAFGAYFASMGLFAFGCAGGNCFGGTCSAEPKKFTKDKVEDVDYEEIKEK